MDRGKPEKPEIMFNIWRAKERERERTPLKKTHKREVNFYIAQNCVHIMYEREKKNKSVNKEFLS